MRTNSSFKLFLAPDLLQPSLPAGAPTPGQKFPGRVGSLTGQNFRKLLAMSYRIVTGASSTGGGFVESSKPLRRRLSHSMPSRAPCSTIAEVDHTTERSDNALVQYITRHMLK